MTCIRLASHASHSSGLFLFSLAKLRLISRHGELNLETTTSRGGVEGSKRLALKLLWDSARPSRKRITSSGVQLIRSNSFVIFSLSNIIFSNFKKNAALIALTFKVTVEELKRHQVSPYPLIHFTWTLGSLFSFNLPKRGNVSAVVITISVVR